MYHKKKIRENINWVDHQPNMMPKFGVHFFNVTTCIKPKQMKILHFNVVCALRIEVTYKQHQAKDVIMSFM